MFMIESNKINNFFIIFLFLISCIAIYKISLQTNGVQVCLPNVSRSSQVWEQIAKKLRRTKRQDPMHTHKMNLREVHRKKNFYHPALMNSKAWTHHLVSTYYKKRFQQVQTICLRDLWALTKISKMCLTQKTLVESQTDAQHYLPR